MLKYVLIFSLISTLALAQQPSTALERVSGSLGQCIANAEKLIDTVVDLQKQILNLQAKVKELEGKQK